MIVLLYAKSQGIVAGVFALGALGLDGHFIRLWPARRLAPEKLGENFDGCDIICLYQNKDVAFLR
jgi:hypothetical protein